MSYTKTPADRFHIGGRTSHHPHNETTAERVTRKSHRNHFLGAGGVFTGAVFAPFFGFFFSLLCELLPLPITHLSSRFLPIGGPPLMLRRWGRRV